VNVYLRVDDFAGLFKEIKMTLFKTSNIYLLDENDSFISPVVDFQLKAHVDTIYWNASWVVKKCEDDDARLYHGIVAGVDCVCGIVQIRLVKQSEEVVKNYGMVDCVDKDQ
jgi:hypothetical protein